MKVALALLADAANASAEGKLNILGQFDTIWAAQTPVRWPMMSLVLKFEATAGEGARHRVGIRVVDQDGKLVAPPVDGDIDLGPPFKPGLPHSQQLIIGIAGAVFPSYGTYSFEILVGGLNVETVPLNVWPASERKKPS